jgi:hypothetical protein
MVALHWNFLRNKWLRISDRIELEINTVCSTNTISNEQVTLDLYDNVELLLIICPGCRNLCKESDERAIGASWVVVHDM